MYEVEMPIRTEVTPQPTKHTRAIHEKYCQLIDSTWGRVPDSGYNQQAPMVPRALRHIVVKRMPKSCEGWLKNLLRWYCYTGTTCSMEMALMTDAYHAQRPCSVQGSDCVMLWYEPS